MKLNDAPNANGFDWSILSAFDDEADMAAYRGAPLDKEFVTITDPYTVDHLALDHESPAP